MAIKKLTNWKGYEAEYYVVAATNWDKITDKTKVEVRCYKNKKVRDADIKDFIPALTRHFYVEGNVDLATIYKHIKDSKKPRILVTPAKKEIAVDGKVTQEATEAEYKEGNELNFFADAVDA